MKGDKVSLVKSDSLGSKEGYSNGSKTIKKYANMSDEIEQLDIETCELLARIRSAAEALEWDTKKVALSKENKELEFKKIKAEMDKARTKLQNYKVELRELNPHEAREYEHKLRKHQEALAEIDRNLVFARTMAEKEALMEGSTAGPKPGEGLSAAQLIEEAKKTQAEDSAALDRMARMVDDSEAIGVQTNVKLKVQTETMKSINDDIHTVQSNMKRADKLLNQIGRRLMTDKLIACLLLLLLIGIVVLVAVRALRLDKSGPVTLQNSNIVIYNGFEIDCSLDFTKTHKQCVELEEQRKAEERLKALQAQQAALDALEAQTPAPVP
mmetsp:Transcript_57355/g.119941  ORF Transcript_57355/g.119941 Transcript_57355/m.119941 type:complete len:326 (-) Transcript_57355:2-979(-)